MIQIHSLKYQIAEWWIAVFQSAVQHGSEPVRWPLYPEAASA